MKLILVKYLKFWSVGGDLEILDFKLNTILFQKKKVLGLRMISRTDPYSYFSFYNFFGFHGNFFPLQNLKFLINSYKAQPLFVFQYNRTLHKTKMPRPNSRGSDHSDDEDVLEAELEKLQRKYKVSEQERLQYSIETQKKIRLQT
jgi:hypothetical protein